MLLHRFGATVFFLLYVGQRAGGYAFAAGACGIYGQFIQHALVVDFLQILTVKLTSIKPSGQGIHRASSKAYITGATLKAKTFRTIIGACRFDHCIGDKRAVSHGGAFPGDQNAV